jgi:hypothetical protein
MANAPFELDDDLEIIERRTDVRITLSIPGRFTLTNRRDMGGQRKEFPCRAVSVSCYALALATPVSGEMGERVIAHVEQFGKLEGPIIRVLEGGFVMELIMPRDERYRLAARLEWFEKLKGQNVKDQRRHVRVVPKNPYSTLVLADGTTTDCLVKDVSASGVAVHADVVPDIGKPVAVGKLVGRVVRRFDDGFAVQFSQVQDPQAVEGLIARPGTDPQPQRTSKNVLAR